jgi:hypothetical protein
MANTIRHKRSSTTGATPSAGSLVTGELAINTADGKLFTKKDSGSVVEIGGSAGGTTLYAGTATVDFGSAGGNVATVAVTGQTWVTATSHVDAFLMGTDSTADHNADEHGIVNMTTRIISITAGTGFTIQAYSEWTLTGTFKIHWRGF